MKISIRSVVLAAALLVLSPGLMAQGDEREAVNQAMQKVMRAFETGNRELMFEVLRKDGSVLGYSAARGQVVTQTTEQWAQGLSGKPADDEAQRKRSYEIVDVSENAAAVKVMLDYPQWKGVDYLALLKIDGKWMVVSKSWSGQRKP